MLRLVDVFREKGTVDELGIGSIRDAFADHFFPGTSTLHTRPRYLLFIPWIYQRLERERLTSEQAARRAHSLQASDLVTALKAGGEESDVIGIEARESLQRPPAEVYWGALGRYQIRVFIGSRARYHTTYDARRGGVGAAVLDESGELQEPSRQYWSTAVPQEPDGLYEAATFELSHSEASFLKDRILATAPDSLLAALIQRPPRKRVSVPWDPAVAERVNARHRSELRLAERFSTLMLGANLTYNLMLAELAAASGLRDDELVEKYRKDYVAWVEGEIRPLLRELRAWNRGYLWEFLGHIAPRTGPARDFAEAWMQTVIADPWTAKDEPDMRNRIREREHVNKGSLARLENRRALERWGGESGLGRLTYRWPNAHVVIQDIARGLRRRRD